MEKTRTGQWRSDKWKRQEHINKYERHTHMGVPTRRESLRYAHSGLIILNIQWGDHEIGHEDMILPHNGPSKGASLV